MPRERLVDTLLLARRKHPGVSNRLDDLCSRYSIDNSRRTKHGALLDAELLAEVYIDLIGARQSQLILASETEATQVRGHGDMPRRQRAVPLVPRVTDADREAHRAFVATLGDKPIWNEYSGRAGLSQLGFAPEAACAAACRSMFWRYRPTKSTGSSIKRREAAVAHRSGDDLAGEREQQPRALDHHQRMQVSLGTFTMRNTPAYARSKLNISLPAFSALPSTDNVTSNSFSERLLAETLIWMLIAGCCCCGASEVGAFGFSNDRSLVYCASTLSWGGAWSARSAVTVGH